MNSYELNEFRYFRDMSIIFIARDKRYSIQKIVQMRIGDQDHIIPIEKQSFFDKYLKIRIKILKHSDFLFPTDEGDIYLPGKFSQNTTKMLKECLQSINPYHPTKLGEDQLIALEGLQFKYQRPRFQVALIIGFLALMGLRPEEASKLRKSDISIGDQKLYLKDTKSQKNQEMPIHPHLLLPLEKYLLHIEHGNLLFIRNSKEQWDRKDIYRAVKSFSSNIGLSSINPRRLRKTAGNLIYRASGSITVARRGMRHADENTTLRNYIDEASSQELAQAMTQYPDFDLGNLGD